MKALKILKELANKDIWVLLELGLEHTNIDGAIKELEALQQRSCKTCKYYDTERPRSHPNYAECNKRDCPLSYVEVHYAFCCSEHTPKEQ